MSQQITITINTNQAVDTQPSVPNSFRFGDSTIRIATIDGEPWFAVADVCAVLGYANSRDALAKHCRAEGVAKRDTPTNSGIQTITYINEGNLYRLIIKSRKPEAEKFESWVCDEVLPSIRKTGSYTQAPARVQTLGKSQRDYIESRVDYISRMFFMNNASHWIRNLLRHQLNVQDIKDIRLEDYPKAIAILEEADQSTTAHLMNFLIPVEEAVLKEYVGKGLSYTPTLAKNYHKLFQESLPHYPNWKEIAAKLEQARLGVAA